MKLFYKPGACSLASHIILRELGVSFDLEKTDTALATTASGIDFRTINPKGYVPALLLDGGDVLTENAAILPYLADLAPERELAPAPGTFARARLAELLSFLSSELHKAFGPFFAKVPPSEAERKQAEAKVGSRLGILEDLLADERPFLLGERYGVADAYAFVMLTWARVASIELSPWPNVRRFEARVGRRAAVRRAMAAEGLRSGEEAA